MRWLKRDMWKVRIAISILLFLMVFMVLIPISARAYEGPSGLLTTSGTVQATPTVDLTVTTLSKQKLAEDIAQGQHTFSNLLWNNAAAFLSVLVVVVGALIGYFRWLAEQRNTMKLALQTAQTEREIVLDNQREVALQTYIDKISELLLHEKLLEAVQENEVSQIALVRTLTILPQLDPMRKKIVVRLLYESRLINTETTIIDMSYANLRGTDLHRVTLKGINLRNTNLRYADLSEAELDGANLSGAKLEGANLTQVNLAEADLSETDLSGTNIENAQSLAKANLHRAKGLTKEQLEICKGKGAIVDEAAIARAPRA